MLFNRTVNKPSEERTVASERESSEREQRRRQAPVVDIWEQDDALVVTADVPGCDESSVDITLEKGVLTIRGAPKMENPEGLTLVYREYEPADYLRTFTLPDEIDRTRVTAVVRNGVLTLTLPKAKEVQPRRIAVSAG